MLKESQLASVPGESSFRINIPLGDRRPIF